jgi:predicted regulator of amino acid metabolism with ACT domain
LYDGAQIAREIGMSQKTVQLVIGWVLTDEELRLRFVERPRETLAELQDQGYELTWSEIDALARSDPHTWETMARRLDPRLQRCSLRSSIR